MCGTWFLMACSTTFYSKNSTSTELNRPRALRAVPPMLMRMRIPHASRLRARAGDINRPVPVLCIMSSQRARSYSLAIARRRRSSRLHNQLGSVSEHGLTSTQIEGKPGSQSDLRYASLPPYSLAFREVFSLFDVNGGGTIDAQELHSALASVDIRLTKEEIEDVLCVMDEDGNSNY